MPKYGSSWAFTRNKRGGYLLCDEGLDRVWAKKLSTKILLMGMHLFLLVSLISSIHSKACDHALFFFKLYLYALHTHTQFKMEVVIHSPYHTPKV